MTILVKTDHVYSEFCGVRVVETAYDLTKKEDRIAVLRLVGQARAKDPTARQDLTALLYGDDSPTMNIDIENIDTPPRRSEDGPHTAYFRQLKAEREERLGRIESLQADAPRPAGDAPDGGWETVSGSKAVCGGANRIVGPWHERAGTGWNWSC